MGSSPFANNWITPDLARTPALAADVAASKQPNLVAPVVSFANKGVAVQNAINDHQEGNGSQSFWAKLASPALTGLEWLGKGIKEVQKDYKFTHAVYTDHGFMQGFAVTLGVIGGGIGGGFLGGPIGAVVGADLAGTALRKLSQVPIWKDTYSDSYNKSEDENYIVSPGRDFTNAASKAFSTLAKANVPYTEGLAKSFRATDVKTGSVGPFEFKLSSAGSVLSGAGDLTFDIVTDPVMILGRFNQLMKTGKLFKAGTTELRYPIMETVPGVRDFVLARTKLALTSDQLDAVRAGNTAINATARTYNRSLEDIADTIKNAKPTENATALQVAAGDLAAKYPQLGVKNVGRMAVEKLDTPDKVHDFIKTALYMGELDKNLAGQAMLPSRTLLRAKLSDTTVVDALRNSVVAKKIIDANGNKIINPEYAALNTTGKITTKAANIYKTFSGYMPYSVDPVTQKLSLTKFKWDAPDAATTVYRIGRIGLGDSASRIMAGKYAEAVATNDLALARSIKNQTLFDAFKALGLPDDNEFVKSIYDQINMIDAPLTGSEVYGVTVAGNILGEYATSQGPKIAGLVSHQAQDMFDIPQFFEIKKQMRNAGLHNKFVGKLDEFTAKYYTNSIFKPLALTTAGFGIRVAVAEMIPTFARYGVINTFKAKLATSVAKSRYNLIPKEASNVFSATMVALGAHAGISPDVLQAGFPAFQEAKRRGLEFAAKMLPDEQIELATRLVLTNNGHFTSEAVSTGHGYDVDVQYQMNQAAHYYFQVQKNGNLFREKNEWTTYSSSDIHFPVRYATNLNKAAQEASNKNIAQDLLNEVNAGKGYLPKKGQLTKPSAGVISPEFYNTDEFQALREALVNKEYTRMLDTVKGTYKPYAPEMSVLTRWIDSISNGSLRTFAQDRVDMTLGMLFGKNGTFHQDFAEAIAKGQNVDFEKIVAMTRKDPQSMPAAVAGPVLVPYTPSKNPLMYITNLGFKKVIDPIVNGLSREPLYLMHVADAYGRMKPQIENGFLTEDQALRIAQTQGSLSMLPQIHNTALRNQFAQIAQNFLPFYFAQEQSLKRAFATLKDTSIGNPAFSRGLGFYQLVEHALSDPTFVQTDDNGNKYINFFGVGALGEGFQKALQAYGVPMVSGLPISAKGSLISLKSVLPELQMPGVSPVLAVSANLVTDWFEELGFPQLKPITKKLVGDISYQRGVLDSLLPAAWLKTLLASGTDVVKGVSFDISGQYKNALASAMATAYYYNQIPDESASAPEKQEFIDRIQNNARSVLIIKTVLNLISPLAPQVKQEDFGLRDEFWKLFKQKDDFGSALVEFMGTHGSRSVSFTVGKTVSNTAGAKYPYIQETLNFIKDNHDKFFTKPGQPTVSQGYFFLIPQENPKKESDRAVYNTLLKMHLREQKTPQELLNSFYVSQGDALMDQPIKDHIAKMQEYQFSPFLKQQELKNWSETMKKMANLHPVWYDAYTSGDSRRQAQNTYNQLVKIFSDPNPPQHNQAKLVQGLIKDYQTHQQRMASFKSLNLQGVASTSETQNWETYLLTLSEKNPKLKSVINSVFRKLG
jgi:hypothetical protein